jgi:hypothetical protein
MVPAIGAAADTLNAVYNFVRASAQRENGTG